jgi:hypothetical protein
MADSCSSLRLFVRAIFFVPDSLLKVGLDGPPSLVQSFVSSLHISSDNTDIRLFYLYGDEITRGSLTL